MSSGAFRPPKEHLGSFQKPSFPKSVGKHLGFDDAAKAIYGKGQSLIESMNSLSAEEQWYEWRSASFFSGLDPNLGSYLEPVVDLAKMVSAALSLLRDVLVAVNKLANLAVNLLKIIIDAALGLLAEIVKILNPTLSAHALFIPPRVGNVGSLPPPSIPSGSIDITTSNAVRSERARQDFMGYLNDMSIDDKLPPAIAGDVSDLQAKVGAAATGSKYLLSTIEKKLVDKTDLCRPFLTPISHCGGVGIFLGTNSILALLKAWDSLTLLFASDLSYPKAPKGLPPIPRIINHRITELTPLEGQMEGVDITGLSVPTQEAVVVSPIWPTTLVTDKVTYPFVARAVFLWETASPTPTDSVGRSAFLRRVQDLNKDLGSLVEAGGTLDFTTLVDLRAPLQVYSTMKLTPPAEDVPILGGPMPKWARVGRKPLKVLGAGYYHIVAIDYYALNGDKAKLIPLVSTPVTARVLDTKSEWSFNALGFSLANATFTQPGEFMDPSATSPRWIAAHSAVALFPDVLRYLLNFIDLLRTYLHSLLDDALDWLAGVIDTLDRTLKFLQKIMDTVTAILNFLTDIANLSVNIGASVLQFSGQGSSKELLKVFQEYLDPTVVSRNSKIEAETTSVASTVTADVKGTKYEAFLGDATSKLEALVRDEPSEDLDNVGSALSVSEKKKIIKDTALKNLREGTPAEFPGISAVWNSSYNMSPVFTPDMTTCGLILLAHSAAYGRVELLINLIDFLFGPEETPTDQTEEEALNAVGLKTDSRVVLEEDTSLLQQDPAALFTDDMKLTTDPNKSPFNFCP
jgi:hypothetical protein